MIEKILLLYTDPHEPVTRVLLHHQQELGIQGLFVKDFLDDNFEIFDRFNLEKTEIEWNSPSIGKIVNSEEIYIINRAVYLPEDWFTDFHLKDREYARQELWSYLVFAFNSFPRITEKPNVGGLNSGCYPLTQQWNVVGEQFSHLVALPDVYIGPIELMPVEWHQQAIFTHPYQFYYWKETAFEGKEQNNVFAIKKPKGQPVLASVIGDDVVLEAENALEVDEHIKQIALQINQSFKYCISEILFFVEGIKITFGMIYNLPFSTAYMSSFEPRLLKWIRTETNQILEESVATLG
jgi:hypothetical protein